MRRAVQDHLYVIKLDSFKKEEAAPKIKRAYDRTAIKFRGVEADNHFSLSDSETDLMQMKNLTKVEHIFRRPRTRFSRGSPFGNSHRESEEHFQAHSGSYDVHSRDSRDMLRNREFEKKGQN
ncbi:hypothetical protein GH714_020761 [Hevea brasiliensis]|uniref:Uncharacterized protein n=1 Tax=Hevea brasiliensis TaxID=3981 RepID=A0A6A6N1I0_HEVBR|nr:hypothetical protein GH714_020761 [Hevea brasiliensis]